MAVIKQTTFTSFNLTESEVIEGSKLTIPQVQVIQNLMADTAENKLRLAFDPTSPELFTQQEAYMRGQIEILQYLLDSSNTAKDLEPGN